MTSMVGHELQAAHEQESLQHPRVHELPLCWYCFLDHAMTYLSSNRQPLARAVRELSTLC